MSFNVDDIVEYVRTHPDAQGRYKNFYHASAIIKLFRTLIEEEQIGELLQKDINDALVALHFLAFKDPTEAYFQYTLTKGEIPSLSHTYFSVLAERPKGAHIKNRVALCVIDAINLKDLVENDPVHILENYRVEELLKRCRLKKSNDGIPPDFQRTVVLVKDKLDNITVFTESGQRIYNENKERFLSNLQYHADLKQPH